MRCGNEIEASLAATPAWFRSDALILTWRIRHTAQDSSSPRPRPVTATATYSVGDLNTIEPINDPMTDLSLLQSALRCAVEIGLSADQLDRLRNLYVEARRDLNKENADLASAELEFELAQPHAGGVAGAGGRDKLEAVRYRMGDIRMRTTALALAILTEEQRRALSTRMTPDEHGRDARPELPSSEKNSKVVEIELAAAVLERMIGWAKIFAWSVAIPATVLVAILTVAGIGKFADFISRVNESEKRVTEYVAKSEKQISDLVGRATDTATKYQAQLDAIEQQQANLKETVNDLERLVSAPGSKVSSAVLGKLQSAFRPFQSYLMSLGYQPERRQIQFAFANPNAGTDAYYQDGTIYVSEKYAAVTDLAFREYLHHVLWDGSGKPLKAGAISDAASALESGLADYFVASYSNNPRPYPREFTVDLEKQPKFSLGQPIERFTTGTTLAGIFWSLRANLNSGLSDKILFESWRSKSVSTQPKAISEMVQSILATTARLAPARRPDVEKILRNGGLPAV